VQPSLLYYQRLKYQPENLELLRRHFELITLPDPAHDTDEVLGRVEALLAPLGYYCGRQKLERAPRLKVIGSNTTGVPHIDLEAAAARGIQVVSLKDYPEFLKTITPTAELTWGLIIALTRNLLPATRAVQEGRWDRRPFGGRAMLSRLSLGVAGCGRLGSMVAAYGLAFGMKVRYCSPREVREPAGLERVPSLEELLRLSDVITIHIPHQPSTEKLFRRELLSRCKPGAYLINTSRGELVDEAALLECLEEGRLAGAALDVLDGEFVPGFEERVKEHPLWQYAASHDNLILTPHIGGSTVDAWRETEAFTIRKVLEALDHSGGSG